MCSVTPVVRFRDQDGKVWARDREKMKIKKQKANRLQSIKISQSADWSRESVYMILQRKKGNIDRVIRYRYRKRQWKQRKTKSDSDSITAQQLHITKPLFFVFLSFLFSRNLSSSLRRHFFLVLYKKGGVGFYVRKREKKKNRQRHELKRSTEI